MKGIPKDARPDFSVDLTGPHEKVTERLERLLPSKPPAPGHILDASEKITQEDEKELEEAHREMDAVWEKPIPPEEAFELACNDSRAFIKHAEEAGYSEEEIASFIELEAKRIVARIPGLDMATVVAGIKETGRELDDDEGTDDALTRLRIERL